jgi:hypothetical protein
MARSFLGGIVAGLILFVLSYLFWQTQLSGLAYKHLPDAQGSAVQTVLAQNLTQTGTGTYRIPNPDSDEGSRLFTRGPTATVDFTTGGYSPRGTSALIPSLIVAVVSGFLLAFGIGAVAHGRSFAELGRLVVLASLGFCAWIFLATPIAYHFGWGFWIYAFVTEAISFIAAGLVVARWFAPTGPVAYAAPVGAESETPLEQEP